MVRLLLTHYHLLLLFAEYSSFNINQRSDASMSVSALYYTSRGENQLDTGMNDVENQAVKEPTIVSAITTV